MNLKSLNFKKAYSSDSDNILHDFYIPALGASVEYYRLAGFFSSTSLALAARGILGLIRNGGIMKLLVSPRLNKDDLEVILDSCRDPEKYIEKKMLEELENLEDEFIRDHVYALGWMIANKKLEIKLAIPYNNEGKPQSYEDLQQCGLFHLKVGILRDSEGNTIAFSGSINETAMSWSGNIEEFKVFRSWESSEEEWVRVDNSKFKEFWDGRSSKVKVMEVPNAVKDKLVKIAPTDVEEINLNKWYKSRKKKIKLFCHQEKAVESWLLNGMKGIFEMATGTGKTFAALGCLDRVSETNKKLLVVITCPYNHLLQQWKREIDIIGIDYDSLIVADSTNPSWKDLLTDLMINISIGYNNKVIVLTTHKTFSRNDFIKIVKDNKSDFSIFLIADEVHGLGAEKTRNGLVDEYDLRLGLSATPKRWFDTVGTNVVYEYFGGIIYEFKLEDAINTKNPATGETYLTPYRYIPKFVSLTNDELEDYIDKTRAIANIFYKQKEDEEKDKILENLFFKRANIIKNAIEKYEVLSEILDEINPPIKWTIIYCSPQQINNVMKIINNRGIIAHRFTMDEGSTPDKRYNYLSERDFILQKFAEEEYQILVAMKCLDEGVDIPPARVAILMASSGNPREYIQRIGRILRRYPGKNKATIYDIVVIPSFDNLPKELRDIEWRFFKKELDRYEEIARIATNNAEALSLVYDIKNRLMGCWKNE